MALSTKDRTLEGGSQACPLYGGRPSIQELNYSPSLELFNFKGHSNNNIMLQEGERSDSFGSYSSGLLPFLSDPSNSSCTTYMVGAVNSPPQEALSVLSNKATAEQWAYSNATTSVLSFEQGDQEDECAAWIDAMDQNYQLSHPLDGKLRAAAAAAADFSSRLIQGQDCFEVGSGLVRSPAKDKRQGKDRFGLICPGAVDGLGELASIGQASALQKRRYTDACDMPSPKKQCGNTRKSKDKTSPTKDPQSIAAKNRRERISERLKILQELVPNGTKVDLVTMLEKAISYVKFLQLQVKVLATDEFWPAQGGKAPDIGQVKEAIDAILSSQRDRSSTSKH
ncbi:hypothetical protein Cni_G11616 [Canna indica]|uniref:BHLH domain-containing protein n=1 Tax=Canna indica TaxID=4628 RepID=A0AAQ3KAK0_9LILI|nr:hypothetical protein Cni_G11616 [Canna indica]